MQSQFSFIGNNPSLVLVSTYNSTDLLIAKCFNNYDILGISIDISLGKAYANLSAILGLHLKDIENAEPTEIIGIPVPMQKHKGFDLSFLGPLNSTLQHIYPKYFSKYRIDLLDPIIRLENRDGILNLAGSFQLAIIKHLRLRISKAIE